ncbi:hypothetical protein YC2023_016624 [Brassica napus]
MFSTDSYSTVRGVDKLIPVDVYLPGCPPKPEAVIDAITKLHKKIAREIYKDRIRPQRGNRYGGNKKDAGHFVRGLVHRSLGFDYQGIETLQIKPEDWHSIAVILYVYGYNYLRSQCAYDVAPGGLLASVYHLTRIEYGVNQAEEVCIKVFTHRSNPRIPSVFWVWKSTDFQERESYDMLGITYDSHPRLKRILMPESWIGSTKDLSDYEVNHLIQHKELNSISRLAQRLEHRICNAMVIGSIPIAGFYIDEQNSRTLVQNLLESSTPEELPNHLTLHTFQYEGLVNQIIDRKCVGLKINELLSSDNSPLPAFLIKTKKAQGKGFCRGIFFLFMYHRLVGRFGSLVCSSQHFP